MVGLAPGLRGRLDAAFSPSGVGYEAASPLELRGPLPGEGASLFYLRNVTAGVLEGDCYDVRLRTERGARVQVASSSATKVFEMRGGAASMHVDLRAEPGSVLVWGPHATILQAGAAYRQSTRVRVERGAIVLAAEVIAFGRLARGERYAFDRFESELIVFRGDACAPAFEERYELAPARSRADEEMLSSALGGRGVLASVYALGVEREVLAVLADAVEGPMTGVGALPNEAGLVVRALCDSLSAGEGFVAGCLSRLMTVV